VVVAISQGAASVGLLRTYTDCHLDTGQINLAPLLGVDYLLVMLQILEGDAQFVLGHTSQGFRGSIVVDKHDFAFRKCVTFLSKKC
jgi:hypothetical protein